MKAEQRKVKKRPVSIRLPLSFDPERMQEELAIAYSFSWRPEEPFSFKDFPGSSPKVFHDGQWKGLSLRAQGGRWERTDPGGPGLDPFEETGVLKHTPYFREIIDSLSCRKRSVRLSSLPAGVCIGEHCDTYHDFKYGQVRLHIPVTTHPDVHVIMDGERCDWKAGELYYGDFSRPHRVENRSPITRVHLILDVIINESLLSLFPDDFVDDVRQDGIVMDQDPISLPAEDLGVFQCKFIIPAGLMRGIFETDEGIAGQFAASIRLRNGKLILFVEERPLITLYPITPTRFCFVGWLGERHLEFQVRDKRVTQLQLVLRHGNYQTGVNLALRP